MRSVALGSSICRADLHLHSTASDGKYTPAHLVRLAHTAGITLMALTDHETLYGVEEAAAAAAKLGIMFLPGVEINTAAEHEVHVLLYGVTPQMGELTNLLCEISQGRQERAPKFLEKLAALGMKMTLDDLQIPEGTDCNRPIVARALVRKGYVNSTQEAFERYLGINKPAYVKRNHISTEQLLKMARREGAVPVLAHPGLIQNEVFREADTIHQLKQAGLMGIEAWHPKHTSAQGQYWVEMAKRHGLLVTGGSDFHKEDDDHGPIGSQINNWLTMQEDTDRLLSIMNMN